MPFPRSIPKTARCRLCGEDFSRDGNARGVCEILPDGNEGVEEFIHNKCLEANRTKAH